MANYIHTTGQIVKKNFYNWLCQQLVAAGWSNISSNYITDFDVWQSLGESGDKNLIIQTRPLNVSGDRSIEQSDYNVMSIRLIGGYSPGMGTAIAGQYNITVGTNNLILDGITFTYNSSGIPGTWKDMDSLLPLIQLDALFAKKYTFIKVSNTVFKIIQNNKYESPTSPVVSGTGVSMTTLAAGVSNSGSFPRTTDTWQSFYILPSLTSYSKDLTTLTYWININKNRISILLDPGDTIPTLSVYHYLGLPDETIVNESNSRGVVYATSCYANSISSLLVTDSPDESAPLSISSSRQVYGTLTPKNPNVSGNYGLTNCTYGSTNEGTRGKLTGFFCMPNQNILNRDILLQNSNQYYVGICQTLNNTSFPSNVIVIQIS